MKKLDPQEKLIVKELIKDPRISDNQIAINTSVPLKTVNRKRKKLEQENLIYYFTHINNWKDGTGDFNAKALYIIIFKEGISKQYFLDRAKANPPQVINYYKHVHDSSLGEKDGNLAYFLTIESRENEDLLEIFNSEVIPNIKELFGENCIKKTLSFNLSSQLNTVHNYIPMINMENGKLKKDWPDDLIYVSD